MSPLKQLWARIRQGFRGASVKQISVQELRRRMDQDPSGAYIDVRTTDEFQDVAIQSFKNYPLQDLSSVLNEWPNNETVTVICKSGVRSMAACEILHHAGISCINVTGGITEWIAAGFDTVKSSPHDFNSSPGIT